MGLKSKERERELRAKPRIKIKEINNHLKKIEAHAAITKNVKLWLVDQLVKKKKHEK